MIVNAFLVLGKDNNLISSVARPLRSIEYTLSFVIGNIAGIRFIFKMNQSIVSSASISESNWVDYIFSSADTVGKYVTSSNIVSRRRGYIWFLMRELNQDRTIDDQRNQSTELKWYYVV